MDLDVISLLPKIILGLDISVLVIFVLCLLISMARGFGKSIDRLICLAIPTLCIFFLLGPISKGIMKIEVAPSDIAPVVELVAPDAFDGMSEEEYNTKYSAKSVISSLIANYIYADDPTLAKDSEMEKLADGAAQAIIKLIVFIIGIALVFLFALLFRLIFWILRKILHIKIEKDKKLLALPIGAAHFILLFMVLYLPLFGLLNVTSTIVSDVMEYKENLNMEEEQIEMFETYCDAIDSSYTKKILLKPATQILCKDKSFTIDAKFVSSFLTIEVEDGSKFNILDEYVKIKDAVPAIVKIVGIVNNVKSGEVKTVYLSDLTDEDLETLANVIDQDGFMKLILPAACEYAVYYVGHSEDSDLKSLSPYLGELKNIDWDAEFKTLADIILVLKNHKDVKIDTENLDQILQSKGVIELCRDLSTKLFELKLITKVAIPCGIEKLCEYCDTNEEIKAYNIDASVLKGVDWEKNIKAVLNFVFDTYETYLDLEVDFSNLPQTLNNKDLPDAVKDVFDGIKDVEVISEKLLPVLVTVGITKLKESQNLDIDIEGLKAVDWASNVSDIGSLLATIITSYQTLEIDATNFSFETLLKNDKFATELDKCVTSIIDVNVVKEYIIPVVMDKLIDKLFENETVAKMNLNYASIKETSWSDELVNIKDVLVAVANAYRTLDFNKDDWQAIIDDPNLTASLNEITTAILKSSLFKDNVLPGVANLVSDAVDGKDLGGIDSSLITELITPSTICGILENDIDKVVDIMRSLKAVGVLNGTFKDTDFTESSNIDALENVVKKVFSLSIISGKESTVFNAIIGIGGIKDSLESYGVSLDPSKVTDWNAEVDNLCYILRNVVSLSGNLSEFSFDTLLSNTTDDAKKECVACIVDGISKSQIMGDSMFNIMNKLLESFASDYVVEFSELDKQLIENETGWKKEALVLLNIVDDAKEFLNTDSSDLTSVDALKVKELMLKASESVVASKVIGNVLNAMLGDKISYDLTSRANMASCADTVCSLISLAQTLQSSTTDLNDATDVDTILNAIDALSAPENNELVNEMLNGVLGDGTDINVSSTEVGEAKSVIDDVISAYQGSSDQENFSKDDLTPEQKQALEDNELASLVYDYLFG